MALQDMGADARPGVPEAHGVISTPAGDAVGGPAPGHRIHPLSVPAQDLHRRAGGHLPERQRGLAAATEDEAPIGAPAEI